MDNFDVRLAEARAELVIGGRITLRYGDANKQPRFEVRLSPMLPSPLYDQGMSIMYSLGGADI